MTRRLSPKELKTATAIALEYDLRVYQLANGSFWIASLPEHETSKKWRKTLSRRIDAVSKALVVHDLPRPSISPGDFDQ